MARVLPDASDVHVWTLNESGPPFANTGTAGSSCDLSVVVGSVTPSQPAIWGNGVRFPGSSANYLRTAIDTTLGESQTISLSAWVYPTNVANPGNVVLKQIKDLGGAGPTYQCSLSAWMSGFSSTYWRQVVGSHLAYASGEVDRWTSDNPPTFGINCQWYLLSVTYDGTTLKAYLNGVWALASTEANINWGNHGPWIVGGSSVNSAWSFPGIIHEVRVASVVRTPDYWRNYYNEGVSNMAGSPRVLDPTKPRSMLQLVE